MPRSVSCYEVLIASPSDVAAERQIIVECIEDWNTAHSVATGVILRPLRWEVDVYPEMGGRPQEIINAQVVNSADMLFGVFWHRIGTPTGVAASGTVEEIDQFVSSNRPVALYFSQAPIPIKHDPLQFSGVFAYKKKLSTQGITFDFVDYDDFRRKVSTHLAAKMNVLLGTPSIEPPPVKSTIAAVSINTPRTGMSGAVRTVNVEAIIENLSSTKMISQYMCVLSVPKDCLTYQSGFISGEVPSAQPERRQFRIPNDMSGPLRTIYPRDKISVFSLDLGIDHLGTVETPFAADINSVLAEKVTVELIVNDEQIFAEKTIAEIFPGHQGSTA